jgi:hypothetical protein
MNSLFQQGLDPTEIIDNRRGGDNAVLGRPFQVPKPV